MEKSCKYKRILLKISGEALKGQEQGSFSAEAVSLIVEKVKTVIDNGIEVALVCGAGNIWRGKIGAGNGMDRVTADYMGMLATVMNALCLKDAFEKMYEQRGMMTTEDLGVTILAGSTLGGGTAINWAASFRTPDHVLQEWAQKYQLPHMTGNDFQASLDAVWQRLGVNTDGSLFNTQNELLAKGAEKARRVASEVLLSVRDKVGY